MKIITVAKADKEEEKNEVSSASAVSRNCKKSIKKDKRKRCKYVYIKQETRIQLLIAKIDLGLTVREACKLLEIPYQNAKTICREFKYEGKVLSNYQMKRHQQGTCSTFKMEQSEFARLRKEILMKVEAFVADCTFSNKVVERVQKSSVDAILYFSHAESYLDRFNVLVDRSGPFNLPIPHSYGYTKSQLTQPWYPEDDQQHDISHSTEKAKVAKTEKEVVTADLHEFLFGQGQNLGIKSGN